MSKLGTVALRSTLPKLTVWHFTKPVTYILQYNHNTNLTLNIYKTIWHINDFTNDFTSDFTNEFTTVLTK